MSILLETEFGWYISHAKLIGEIYSNVSNADSKYHLKPDLFKILSPYKIKQEKAASSRQDENNLENEVFQVRKMYNLFYAKMTPYLEKNSASSNDDALNMSGFIYSECNKNILRDTHGTNNGPCILKNINTSNFLFPENCQFFCKDVSDFPEHIKEQKFDVILLDPPWWNKYIRRKRKHSDNAYDMMYNDDLKMLPLENHLKDGGLIVVWCTNSDKHLYTLINEIFPKWGVKYVAKWYWIKITQSGMPVCQFSKPPRKQPFEQIIFGCHESRIVATPPDGKLVVSVPSALHSHKPPLIKLLEKFLPTNPSCLEIFSRYLLPNWTSYGRETLKFQHESLYEKVFL